MTRMTYGEYLALIVDEATSDSEILRLSRIVKGEGGFDFTLQPNPELVDVSDDQVAEESAITIGNSLYRWRRARSFRKRLGAGEALPVLVSEGDSWFQFPALVDEVIDHLKHDYLIWSVGAAGDTASNMVFGGMKKKSAEYLLALRHQQQHVRGFLFSAAGNDVIGEDPATGRSALLDILKDYRPGFDQYPHEHINFAVYGERIAFLREAYQTVIGSIRREPGFETLPIFVHGYDYPFPYPWSNDPRDPSYAAQDQWLGKAFAARRFPVAELRRDVLKVLIDGLYDMLGDLAGSSGVTGVWVVDCRNAMPEVADWNDEIHGTSAGFAKVAERFRSVIREVIGGQVGGPHR